MKLSRAEAKKLQEVDELVALERRLTVEEREFVLEHYQEGARCDNAALGAFFTPQSLARDFAIEVPGGCDTIVDLCAGIGSLAYWNEEKAARMVCVERCAEYVRIGKKVMPDAQWIHADVFGDWVKDLDGVDCVISNPPFGRRIRSDAFEGQYTGSTFEYRVIELASRIADYGVFILPQGSAPFSYSNSQRYTPRMSPDCQKFVNETGIVMGMNCGIDTAGCRDQWHGVSPVCEIVVCDFDELARGGTLRTRLSPDTPPVAQFDLFATA
ncbi:methyltransferase [Burkholderia cenocepacia]|uniref:methyltransferase n=1 Tax=Burkholderia cenocepacia TaxID=95486 RepID=UPI00196B558A|nr:methyltransferase [Burkholderia cenocepacia]MBN3507184.1 methyltransferase [Burkholderia cenocepacia]MBR8029852.1 methyltransferase [Burkholderia cenocepacia]MBR8172196.1 methyltransferase [Burkholderia cenocepacia]